VLALAGALAGGAAGATRADPGVTAAAIVVGGTAPLSGDASFARGAAAYLADVNRRGGVYGRTVAYRLVDDGGDPAQALAATQQLVEADGVFAIFGTAGTASSLAVRPYLDGAKVPHLLASTGAAAVGGFRPTYRAEGWVLGSYVVRTRPGAVVGVVHSADVEGRELLAGLREAVARTRVRVVARALDVTVGVEAQVEQLEAGGATALALFVPPAEAAAGAAGAARAQLLVTAESAARGRWPDGAVSIGWTKDPGDRRWRGDEALRPYRPLLRGRGAGHVQGMAAAFELVRLLRAVGEEPTRTGVAARLRGLRDAANPFLHPGIVVATSATDRFPLEQAVLRRSAAGRWAAFGGVWRHRPR
jgi:hypothetical protein